MKKFDFSKEFGNIDSKYISEAEEEMEGEKRTSGHQRFGAERQQHA